MCGQCGWLGGYSSITSCCNGQSHILLQKVYNSIDEKKNAAQNFVFTYSCSHLRIQVNNSLRHDEWISLVLWFRKSEQGFICQFLQAGPQQHFGGLQHGWFSFLCENKSNKKSEFDYQNCLLSESWRSLPQIFLIHWALFVSKVICPLCDCQKYSVSHPQNAHQTSFFVYFTHLKMNLHNWNSGSKMWNLEIYYH